MTVQELLDKIFDGKETLSKTDVLSGIENSGAKLADLTDGKYMDVNKHAAELRDREASVRGEYEKKLAESAAELKRFDGINPDDARRFPAELAEQKKTAAIREALLIKHVRDIASAMPHIDQSKVEFDADKKEFTGLTEQVDSLAENKPFLFDNGTPAGQKSSGTKSGASTTDGDVLDENRMRAAMGLPAKK